MNDVIRYTAVKTDAGLWHVQDGINEGVDVDSPTLAAWLEDQLARAEYLIVAVPEQGGSRVLGK